MNAVLAVQLGINVFLLSSSVLLLLISLVLRVVRLSPVRRLVFLSLFAFSSSMWFLIRHPLLGLGTDQPLVYEVVDTYCQYGISFFSLAYVQGFVTGIRKKAISLCWLWTAIFIASVSLLQQVTSLTFADFLPFGALCNAVFIAVIVLCVSWEVFREKNMEARRLLTSALPIIAGGLLEICNFLLKTAIPVTFLFFTGFMLFMLLQVFLFVKHLQERALQRARMEQELTDARVSTMLSQIQPHFLYNTLLGIKQLCDTEPAKASDALEHFAYYLRGNLHSISAPYPIAFKKEVEHIQDYLYLEKMRFEERLTICWNLDFWEFTLPSLTLQPIVENAVRHGIVKKQDGGTLTICSARVENAAIITVTDNGVGFDTTATPDASRPHIGIENVRKRLELQCAGSLAVRSTPGGGTEVKITLPISDGRFLDKVSTEDFTAARHSNHHHQ